MGGLGSKQTDLQQLHAAQARIERARIEAEAARQAAQDHGSNYSRQCDACTNLDRKGQEARSKAHELQEKYNQMLAGPAMLTYVVDIYRQCTQHDVPSKAKPPSTDISAPMCSGQGAVFKVSSLGEAIFTQELVPELSRAGFGAGCYGYGQQFCYVQTDAKASEPRYNGYC